MKLGIDLGNKTFTVMRVDQDGVEPVPNISTHAFGASQESYPAIFTYADGHWLLSHEQENQSVTNVLQLQEQDWQAIGITREEGLSGILQMLREIIERNDPGNPIEQAVYAYANEQHKAVLETVLQQTGWPKDTQLLPETVAALFGSGLEKEVNLIGATRTVLILEGKVHELVATVYTVTVTKQNDALYAEIQELSRASTSTLGGAVLEQMLAARAKQIAQQAGTLDIEQTTTLDWLNFVAYIKDLFLVEDAPYIAGDFKFADGTAWEQPEELASDDMYAVFRGEPFMLDGSEQTRQIEEELRRFIYQLCDDGGITAAQIQHIVLAGGTFRLPFWRTTIEQLFSETHVLESPDNMGEVGIVGRGCANYLAWQQLHQFTYRLRKRSGQYIGISYREQQDVKFKPLLALRERKVKKSGSMLIKLDDRPLVVTVYQGPQTEQLEECEKLTTLRFYHHALQQQLQLDHLAFLLVTNEQGELIAEIQHPYTNETILKEVLFSGRAKEGQLND